MSKRAATQELREGLNKQARTAPENSNANDDEPTSLTANEFVLIHRFLHDPAQPLSLDTIPRFGVLHVGTWPKFKKRCLVLPGRLGRVGIPDDRPSKKSAYAARMRAGGCISWWNSMGKNTTGYKFISQYSSMLESLEWNSKCTISQMGRFPPIKGSDAAPINDLQLNVKDPSCMAIPSEDDPFFTARSSASSGAVFLCELAKSGKGKCKGCSQIILKNEPAEEELFVLKGESLEKRKSAATKREFELEYRGMCLNIAPASLTLYALDTTAKRAQKKGINSNKRRCGSFKPSRSRFRRN